mmetsp:Transcript_24538/g.38057  ORF Transcript_24538/g.38057 Transcript_24538/m.38057 type:complete len:184 (+) Transcript_24538:152-703(+)
MNRVMNNDFNLMHQVTIGVDFGSYALNIKEKSVKLQIWDTAGQEAFRAMTRVFYRNANCVFLCYDVTREETFEGIPIWLNEIKEHANEDARVFLIGNKSELTDKRVIDFDRAMKFALENNIHMCFETSAKTGDKVEKVFSVATKLLFEHAEAEDQKEEPKDPVRPTPLQEEEEIEKPAIRRRG